MKPIYTFLLFSYLVSTTLHAQDTLDCDLNMNRALRYLHYLKNSTDVKTDSIKAIAYLKPCVDAENAMAQLLMARLYLNSNDNKNLKKGFRLTKKAAKQDFALAAYDLGVLYKYGKGSNQNLAKASKWFRKGYELGDSKAAYSLGYMFFKGFGNEAQDYKKAVKWFKKSDSPMAKHWLAVCYYFGYGVHQDKSKALQLLKENPIENSEKLLSSLNKSFEENDLNNDEVFVLNQFYEQENNTDENAIDISSLIGAWAGTFIQFDWSNSMVMQKRSTSINFIKDSVTGGLTYETVIADNYNSGKVMGFNNVLKLDNFSLKIEHPYSSNTTAILEYEIIPSEIQLINYKDDEFLVFSTESFIDGWKEPGSPMLFIFRRAKKVLSSSNIEISNEAMAALEAQEDSFIKLYPNPFKNDLIIGYDLDKPTGVSINITSTNGSKSYTIASDSYQNVGMHTYSFDGSILKKGIYVINISYGNERATKMIIKN